MEDFHDHIRSVPDWPKEGVVFRDWNPLLAKPGGVAALASQGVDLIEADIPEPDIIVGAESRGFILGPMIADQLNSGFVPVRKPGKTPTPVHSHEYDLEYGSDTIELGHGLIPEGSRVVIHDDLLATGGTAVAAATLVEKAGGEVAGFLFAIELEFLPGRELLVERFGVPVLAIHAYSEE